MEIIKIQTEYIKLDQLLKFSGIAFTGGDAKYIIENGFVSLNGEKELRRGKKLYKGDIIDISLEGKDIKIKIE